MSYLILENLILTLLESRGTLKFNRAGIKDDRRETMALPANKLMTRAKLAGAGDEEDLDVDKGVTFNKKPYANIDAHPYKMKMPHFVLEPSRFDRERIRSNRSLNVTMHHEDLHSMFARLLEKLNITSNPEIIVSELFETVQAHDLQVFEQFMSILRDIAAVAGADEDQIEEAYADDEQFAYLLTYLESPVFRKQIMEAYAEMLHPKSRVPKSFFSEWKKFDSSLKRVWRALQEAAKELE